MMRSPKLELSFDESIPAHRVIHAAPISLPSLNTVVAIFLAYEAI
jgi:hypothetical protein